MATKGKGFTTFVSQPAIRVNLPETAAQFAAPIEQVQSGEEILLSKSGILVARLLPVQAEANLRVPGQDKGKAMIAPDFDAPLPKEILNSFLDPASPSA
ncbi:MAG: type II toxin-antitoxin system Phd/YefM family antitoxin [Leptolyngbyaceae cyanobacterium]